MKTITKQHMPLQNEYIKGDQFREPACEFNRNFRRQIVFPPQIIGRSSKSKKFTWHLFDALYRVYTVYPGRLKLVKDETDI